MEEVLRAYFVRSGYYTLRGVPFVYKGFDVTDVDIWLYDRPSPVSRQRIIVDIKNKKTPQAIERIFWAKGLQETLGVDQAIVATTDKRPDVAEFGHTHGVVVMDGQFLAKLMQGPDLLADRLSEEEFGLLVDSYKLNKLAGDWRGRLKRSKQLVLTGLHYNQVNHWLSEGRFFAEQTMLVPTHKNTAARITYVMASLIALSIDFLMKDLAFSDPIAKFDQIKDGLQFGSSGSRGMRQIIDTAVGLVEQYIPQVAGAGARIRRGVAADMEAVPAAILAEYFSKSSTYQHLFRAALDLEAAAYGRYFRAPADLPVEARSLVSVLLDFWGIDRVRFMDGLASDAGSSGASASGVAEAAGRAHGSDLAGEVVPTSEAADVASGPLFRGKK